MLQYITISFISDRVIILFKLIKIKIKYISKIEKECGIILDKKNNHHK